MGKFLSKNAIEAACDRRTIEVEVPEWGGMVRLVAPCAGDSERYQFKHRASLERTQSGEVAGGIVTSELVCMCLCDDEGKRMFADAEVAEFARTHSGLVVERLWKQCLDLCGLSERAQKDAEKN